MFILIVASSILFAGSGMVVLTNSLTPRGRK